jgi:uncharacterized membrane protein
MAAAHSNTRLEMFCDGVFAIAITLLIIEIKVPHSSHVHSVSELWQAAGHLWTSYFAFLLSFIIILITWVGHHSFFKLVNKHSPKFLYANGLLLLSVVVMPFLTAFVAEYLNTPYAKVGIVLYCFSSLFNNIAWIVLYETSLDSKGLARNEHCRELLVKVRKQSRYAFVIYSFIVLVAFWFPVTAFYLNTALWLVWLVMGITLKPTEDA